MNIASPLASRAADFKPESAAPAVATRIDPFAPPTVENPKPLVRISDLAEFRRGFVKYSNGTWSVERWITFRLRFGVYAQRQEGQHMLRIKIPGGRLNFAQARALAAANRTHAGSDIHFTTRQAAQLYFLPFERLPGILADLADGGLTTREAAGNTFRNVTSCGFAGICPREIVDAGAVAERLATTWLRDPLVQHMPRKFKTTVSGCAADCGASAFDDLGLVAVERDGRAGFRVLAGGGLGAQPHPGIVILDFIEESDVSAMQEALARLHQRHSNRKKKMASRIKFLVERFGAEDFAARVRAEFEAVRTLPRRPSQPLHWRVPTSTAVPDSGDGRWVQPDGAITVVVRLPLGMIDSNRLAALAALAEATGAREFRAMRDQNILIVGIPAGTENDFVAAARALRLEVATQTHGIEDLVACPGTSTCPIGITNSNGLAESLRADTGSFAHLPAARVRISGCPNSCGQHHLGDFGLHGLSKKIDGRAAPHYQIHLGGDPTDANGIALEGPIVLAHQAKGALKLLTEAFHAGRQSNESVRAWAERLGESGVEALLAPLRATPMPPDVHTDIGDDLPFQPPRSTMAECAAAATAAEHLADLAETARRDVARWNVVGDTDQARAAARESVTRAGRRLLATDGIEAERLADDDVAIEIRARHPDLAPLLEAMTAVAAHGRIEAFDGILAVWAGEVDRRVEARLAAALAKPM